MTLAVGHGVEAPVDPVVEMDIRGPRRAEERIVPLRSADSRGGVACRVFGPRVRLCFDDSSGRAALWTLGYEYLAEEGPRDVACRAGVEASRQRFEPPEPLSRQA